MSRPIIVQMYVYFTCYPQCHVVQLIFRFLHEGKNAIECIYFILVFVTFYKMFAELLGNSSDYQVKGGFNHFTNNILKTTELQPHLLYSNYNGESRAYRWVRQLCNLRP